MSAVEQPIEQGAYRQVEEDDRGYDDGHDNEVYVIDARAEGKETDQNAYHRKLDKQHTSI